MTVLLKNMTVTGQFTKLTLVLAGEKPGFLLSFYKFSKWSGQVRYTERHVVLRKIKEFLFSAYRQYIIYLNKSNTYINKFHILKNTKFPLPPSP